MLIEWTQAAEDDLVEALVWHIEQADKETGRREGVTGSMLARLDF